MPARLSREESDAMAGRIQAHFEKHGFGLWAVERRDTEEFIGFTGLAIPAFEAHFTPCVEIGWRLAAAHWGRGFATEAAQAVMRYGFEELGLTEIVSLTVPLNVRSRRVMEKLGMTRDPADDFDHPRIEERSWLRRHVLYRTHRQLPSRKEVMSRKNGLPPIHPGEIIKEDILPSVGLSVTEAAKALGVSRQMLHDILAERKPLSAVMCLKVARLFGSSPEVWMRLQAAYDLGIRT
jgi:ribosomal-protein-alanine N-acetyltransferase